MSGVNEMLAHISNMANDINNSYKSIPLDLNLNILSPIEEINKNLMPFSNYLRLAHMNSVSIPLHREEIFRVISKTDLDIIGFSETNIKKIHLKIFFTFLAINFLIKIEIGVTREVWAY